MKSKAKVPALAEASESYRDLQDRHDRLRTQLVEKQKERVAIAQSSRSDARSRAQIEKDQRVAALVGDKPGDEAATGTVALMKIDNEIADIRSAIGVMEGKLSRERVVASAAACEKLKPDYSRLIGRIANSLIELDRLYADYEGFVTELNGKDIAWVAHLRPMGIRFLGRPGDPHGSVAHWLREAIEYRLIEPSVMPKELRRAV